jgi:hypothetical protein
LQLLQPLVLVPMTLDGELKLKTMPTWVGVSAKLKETLSP